jgi:hypothetical protein
MIRAVMRVSAARIMASHFVIARHSRSKNGVASLAYDPAIHFSWMNLSGKDGCPGQARA